MKMSQQQQLTDFAQVYSHPQGLLPLDIGKINHKAIAYTVPYKSGLTPLHASVSDTYEELQRYEDLSNYQASRLKGFTASELEALESLARKVEDVDVEILEIPIMPIFAREKWQKPLPLHLAREVLISETKAFRYPRGLGRPGFWDASNDLVWDVLQPALKLVTMILSNWQTWQWWDALLGGRYEQVPENLVPIINGKKLKDFRRFWRNQPFAAFDQIHKMRIDTRLDKLGREIDFAFFSGVTYPDTGMLSGNLHSGYTIGRSTWGRTTCFLAFEELEPLMNPQLSNLERLMVYFEIAAGILHEFAHSVMVEIDFESTGKTFQPEPHFEDECMEEIGFSMESAIFGGLSLPFNQGVKSLGLPPAGRWKKKFQSITEVNEIPDKSRILLSKPADFFENTFYPIPTMYFALIFTEEFWQLMVHKVDPGLFHALPLIFGMRHVYPVTSIDDLIKKDDYPKDAWTPITKRKTTIRQDMTAVQKLEAELENVRQDHVIRVDKAFKKDRTLQSHVQDEVDAGTRIIYPKQKDIYVEPLYDPDLPYERFDVIRSYLFANRQALALDTLYFEIPEHLLLAYIHRSGLADLLAEEWRAFLLRCHRAKYLFSLPRTFGSPPTPFICMVKRLDNGWPIGYTPPPRNLPVHMDTYRFQMAAKDVLISRKVSFATSSVAKDAELIDIDADMFLHLLNAALKERKTSLEMTMEEMNASVAQCETIKKGWTFGPAGIIGRMAVAPWI